MINDDDEMSVSPLEETGPAGGNLRPLASKLTDETLNKKF